MAPNKTAPAGWTPARGDDHIYKPTESIELPASAEAQRARLAGEPHRIGVYSLSRSGGESE